MCGIPDCGTSRPSLELLYNAIITRVDELRDTVHEILNPPDFITSLSLDVVTL